MTDSGCSRIFEIIRVSKTASEISDESKIPLTTVYRKLKILKKLGLLDVSGEIRDGIKLRFFRKGKMYTYYHDNPKITRIADIVTRNPGIRFNEIQHKTGFSSGALSTYMYDLIGSGTIVAKRTSRRTWFFPTSTKPRDMNLIIYLRKETSRRILDFLASSPATFREIKSITKKSPATTSIVLKELLDLGLIKRENRQDGSFEIADKENICRMLQKINAKDIKLQQ